MRSTLRRLPKSGEQQHAADRRQQGISWQLEILQLQRAVGNRAVADTLSGILAIQRRGCEGACGCGGTCGGWNEERADDSPVTVQRKCVETGHDHRTGSQTREWDFEYDGCSLPERLAVDVGGVTLGGLTKDNPAGGRDTRFALGKPTSEGGVACDRHDECYQTCGADREACDQRIHHDMKEICAKSSESAKIKDSCRRYAGLYYAGLLTLGDSPLAGRPYSKRQKEVCTCNPATKGPTAGYPPPEALQHQKGSQKGRFFAWAEYLVVSTLPPLSGYKRFPDRDTYEGYIASLTEPDAVDDRLGKPKKTLRMRR